MTNILLLIVSIEYSVLYSLVFINITMDVIVGSKQFSREMMTVMPYHNFVLLSLIIVSKESSGIIACGSKIHAEKGINKEQSHLKDQKELLGLGNNFRSLS